MMAVLRRRVAYGGIYGAIKNLKLDAVQVFFVQFDNLVKALGPNASLHPPEKLVLVFDGSPTD